ncbi:hypothetical protein ABZ897_01045 [Nonomuraea sp. NPDC046802]
MEEPKNLDADAIALIVRITTPKGEEPTRPRSVRLDEVEDDD